MGQGAKMRGRQHEQLKHLLTRREALVKGGATLAAIGGLGPLLAACDSGDRAGAGADSLVYLSDSLAEGLNWSGPAGTSVALQFAVRQTYSNLVTYEFTDGEDGFSLPDFSQPVGELAEGWTQNGLDWTFKLREGIMSAAGNELTSDDVIWTFERAKDNAGDVTVDLFLLSVGSVMEKSSYKDASADEKKIKDEITKVDKYTFTIKQLAPNQLMPHILTIHALSIIDSTEAKKHATSDDPFAHRWLNETETAGFGPYRIRRRERDRRMVYESNPNWTPLGIAGAEVKEFEVSKVPSISVRVESIQRGESDIVTDLTTQAWDSIDETKAQVLSIPSNLLLFLPFNFGIEPFDNRELRQALAWATPYNDIIEVGFGGEARRSFSVGIPSNYPGYHEVRKYDTDLDEAASLLEKAGFPGGEGLEQFGGAMTLFYLAESQALLEPIATLIQSSWREIGVNVKLNPIPNVEFVKRQQSDKDLPIHLSHLAKPLLTDSGYAVQLFFATQDLGSNYGNYSNPELDDLWENRARNEPDDAERNEELARIQEITMRDLPFLPICEYNYRVGLAPGVSNFHWLPDNVVHMKFLNSEDVG